MKDRVLRMLLHSRKMIEQKEDEIRGFEDNPFVLFSGLQENKELIPELLMTTDDTLAIEYQNWQYTHVVQEINAKISIMPFTVGWNPEHYPSPIYILDDGYPVAAIHPYLKLFERLPNEDIMEQYAEYVRLTEERMALWEEVQIAHLRRENPYIDVDEDSITDTLKTVVLRKRYEKQRMAEIQGFEERIAEIDNDLKSMNLHIERMTEEDTQTRSDMEKLYRKFSLEIPLTYEDGHDTAVFNIEKELRQKEDEITERLSVLEDKAFTTEQY